MEHIRNKTVIITGASSGIGEAVSMIADVGSAEDMQRLSRFRRFMDESTFW